MAITVSKIDVVNSQSFKISIKGLLVYTKLSVYYDSKKVSANNIVDLKASKNSVTSQFNPYNTLLTDEYGNVEFLFYLPQDYSELLNKSENVLVDYLRGDIGTKQIVVVDEASISTSSLPDNWRTVSRCYAERFVQKTYEVSFTDVKDFGSIKPVETSTRIETFG